MLNKKLKRYQMGGWGMSGGGNWQGAGNAFAAVGGTAASLWDQLETPKNGVDKNAAAKGALSGAASGAALGTQILPGWGTAVGAVVGGVAGAIGGNRKKKQQEEAAAQARQQFNRNLEQSSSARLANYDTYGGQEEEGIYALGGRLKQINSDTVEVEGQTHAQGGVSVPEMGAELEDNETVAGDFVFSDYLGFADRHKKIANQIGRIEKKPLNRERRVSLEILRKKENALANEQEDLKAMLGLPSTGKMQMGGMISGPTYLQPNPNATPEANDNKAIANLHQALRFKNSLTGANMNLVRYDDNTTDSFGNPVIRNSEASQYGQVDPSAIQKADSVINATRPIFLRRKNSLTKGTALTEPTGTPLAALLR